MKKTLNIILLVDLPVTPDDPNLEDYLQDDDWRTEKEVYNGLKHLGHNVRMVGMYDKIEPLLEEVKKDKPDLVFNQVEHFNGNTTLERDVVGLLELLHVPYTGSGPTGLMLCKNKGLMKKLLSFHHIKTPKFDVIARGKKIYKPADLKYPLIVKPTKEDASYGIAQASYVETDAQLEERVKFLHDNMKQNALIEEYIDGRELYVGILGNERLQVLSPREMIFKEVPDDEPKIATFKAKWDKAYQKKWGIDSRAVSALPDGVMETLSRVCKRAYKVLQIRGYGRIDLRLTPKNEIHILEANPNPGLTRNEEFTLAADKAGLSFTAMLEKIIRYGLQFRRPE